MVHVCAISSHCVVPTGPKKELKVAAVETGHKHSLVPALPFSLPRAQVAFFDNLCNGGLCYSHQLPCLVHL